MIPFNKPYVVGTESGYISEAIRSRKLSGDGPFTKRAQRLLEGHLGSGRSLLTTSCTDALEAAALLCGLEPGDEVIMPSFTFVSTANAFALRGARIRFADSYADNPNIDPNSVRSLINSRTRVIVPVHYAGVACDMDTLQLLADSVGAIIIEDAAQAIASSYKGKPLGTLGSFSAFSFHETKNIISGEGGALHVNDLSRMSEAEIVREKGTNRSAFFRGEVGKYNWIGLGSSYLPSELIAAFLTAQLEELNTIQARRIAVWKRYSERLAFLARQGYVSLPVIPVYANNNAHMFYMVLENQATRARFIEYLKAREIMAVFHYQALHASAYFRQRNTTPLLPQADRYTECLIRLPLYAGMKMSDVDRICDVVISFFN